jgi:hypothetical protein
MEHVMAAVQVAPVKYPIEAVNVATLEVGTLNDSAVKWMPLARVKPLAVDEVEPTDDAVLIP